MKKALCIFLLPLFISCDNTEIGNWSDVKPEAVYQQYQVSATEGSDSAELLARFRFAGPDGTTLVLDSNSSVRLNGRLLEVDSSRGMGACYAAKLPLCSEALTAVFEFDNGPGKSFRNTALLTPFQLISTPATVLSAEDLELKFSGLRATDSLHVAISDSSNLPAFQDLDTVVLVVNGRAVIPGLAMRDLAPGPVSLYISKEGYSTLSSVTREGGDIAYRYELAPRTFLQKK